MPQTPTEQYIVECETCGKRLWDCGYDRSLNIEGLPESQYKESGHYCSEHFEENN